MIETGLNVLVGLAPTMYNIFDKDRCSKLCVKRDFYKLMLILIYKTERFCSRSYYTGTKTTNKSDGSKSFERLIYKNWLNDIAYLEELLDDVHMFYSIYKIHVDKVEGGHNFANNVFNTCSSLLGYKKCNESLEPMKFRSKFKKEFDYIAKVQSEFRKRVL